MQQKGRRTIVYRQEECHWIGRHYFYVLEMGVGNERNVGIHLSKYVPPHSSGTGQTPELDKERSFSGDNGLFGLRTSERPCLSGRK